jgi:hypothetical protein
VVEVMDQCSRAEEELIRRLRACARAQAGANAKPALDER